MDRLRSNSDTVVPIWKAMITIIAFASLMTMGLFAPRDTKARTVYIQTDIGIFGNMISYEIQTRGENR